MIQSQLLLAVPTIVLEHEIKTQIESNPMLEELDSSDEVNELSSSEPEEPTKEDEADDSYGLEEWFEYTAQESNGYKSPEASDRNTEGKGDYEVLTEERLRETPLEQLHRSGLDEKSIIIGEEIIGSLDDDGYLRDNVDEIREDIRKHYNLEVTAEEFEQVLKIIQRFDPPGMGARNLQECLKVQLEEMELDEETRRLCITLINDYFEDFKMRRFENIANSLHIDMEGVKKLFEVIHRLNPVPGNLDNAPERNYVYPDLTVKKTDGDFTVELNDDYIPRLRINRKYLQLLKRKDTPRQTREFIRDKLQAAKWFIGCIQSRRETMLKVMKAIVNRQRKFFETNGEILKPLFEKDVASDIKMDHSTISRAVRNKYVQTDFGVFELKHFFSHGVQIGGDDISNRMIKEKIKELIDNEDKSRPLTDDKIAGMMTEFGMPVARRTVAKYREAMRIPKATLRRGIVIQTPKAVAERPEQENKNAHGNIPFGTSGE